MNKITGLSTLKQAKLRFHITSGSDRIYSQMGMSPHITHLCVWTEYEGKDPGRKSKTKLRTMEVFKHLNSKYEIGLGEKTVDYNLKDPPVYHSSNRRLWMGFENPNQARGSIY